MPDDAENPDYKSGDALGYLVSAYLSDLSVEKRAEILEAGIAIFHVTDRDAYVAGVLSGITDATEEWLDDFLSGGGLAVRRRVV